MPKEYQSFIREMQGNNNLEGEVRVALRPTLYIGLGGFGNAVLQKVKTFIMDNIPDYASGYGFIGLDTFQLDNNNNLSANQYVPLSVGVDPNIVAKDYPQFLKWYSDVTGYYKARSIQSGADACKAVGRLAFRFPPTLNAYINRLDGTANFLMEPREGFVTGQPIKVYIISTVAGGTGSGCLLDALFVTGKLLRETLGADFPYQAILVSPEMLKNTPGRNRMIEFCANSYASLSELYHFLVTGNEMVMSYDERRFKNLTLNSLYLPNHFYYIGAQNEDGNTIASMPENLQDIIVSYLVSEIQTPMPIAAGGGTRIQDKENIHFGSPGKHGGTRAFSSFGVVRTGYPADIAESLYAYRVLQAALSSELASPDHTRTFSNADNWLTANKLKEEGVDQLQDLIKGYIQGDYQIRLDACGTLMQPGFKYEKLVADSQNFIKEKKKIIEGDRKKAIEAAAKTVISSITKSFVDSIEVQKNSCTVGEALEYLKIVQDMFKGHQNALKNELKQSVSRLTILENEVDSSLKRMGESIKGWWQRKERVNDAVSDFGLRLQSLLNQQTDTWIKEKADEAYSVMIVKAKELEKEMVLIVGSLSGRLAEVNQKIVEKNNNLDKMSKIEGRGEGNRFSLVNASMVNQLYDELFKPGESAVVNNLRKNWLDSGYLSDIKSKFGQWIDSVAPSIYELLKERFSSITFVSIIERFFNREQQQRDLFASLKVLSTPLFWLDPNKVEDSYDLYWIIGIHPDLKNDFVRKYQNQLGGLGCSYAHFGARDEIILYQLKIGYAIQSFRALNGYEMDYRLRLEEIREGLAKKQQIKPIHGWPEAEMWANLIPRPGAEDALRWFILGRAFNQLFPTEGASPTKDKKNVSFMSAIGANYYMQISEDSDKELIGKGLSQAVANFSERKDWQDNLRQKIESKIKAVGEETIGKRLENEYFPVLKDELAITENSPDAQTRERREILIKFRAVLNDFIREELKSTGI